MFNALFSLIRTTSNFSLVSAFQLANLFSSLKEDLVFLHDGQLEPSFLLAKEDQSLHKIRSCLYLNRREGRSKGFGSISLLL